VCEGQGGNHGGVCVSGGASDCAGSIGLFGEGWIEGKSDAFLVAYLRYAPLLGCPFDNGGGLYVHRVREAVDVQDFFQPDEARRLSADGQSALLGDEGAMGGAVLLGPPLDESRLENNVVQQEFASGWMELYANSTVVAHFDDPAGLDLDETLSCTDGAGIHFSFQVP
jgi:hypothetical protein